MFFLLPAMSGLLLEPNPNDGAAFFSFWASFTYWPGPGTCFFYTRVDGNFAPIEKTGAFSLVG